MEAVSLEPPLLPPAQPFSPGHLRVQPLQQTPTSEFYIPPSGAAGSTPPHTQSWGPPPSCHLCDSRWMTRRRTVMAAGHRVPSPGRAARELVRRPCLERESSTVVPSHRLGSTSWGPQLFCCCSMGSSRPTQVFDLPAGRLGLSRVYRWFYGARHLPTPRPSWCWGRWSCCCLMVPTGRCMRLQPPAVWHKMPIKLISKRRCWRKTSGSSCPIRCRQGEQGAGGGGPEHHEMLRGKGRGGIGGASGHRGIRGSTLWRASWAVVLLGGLTGQGHWRS